MKISSVAEMREMDRTAIEDYGVPGMILMENAGLAACRALERHTEISGRTFLVFCGIGNNGGDGLVTARVLHSKGARVRVFLMSDPEKYRGDARSNFQIAKNLQLEMRRMDSPEKIANELFHCHWIIDGIFGTGLSRSVEGKYRKIMEWINASGKPVMSLDIPSGVSGDTGRIMGTAVSASITVTFGLPKYGNLLYPGAELGGELYVTNISFPPSLHDAETIRAAVNEPPPLPPRNPAGYKGSFGDVLFIAGAAGYYGAPRLSAFAHLKAGGGYARLAAPASIVPRIAADGAEIVFLPQKETAEGSVSFTNREALAGTAEKADMVVMGPGLSLADETRRLVRSLTKIISVPLLLDGDGLTAVSEEPEIIRKRSAPTILTPHSGEMSRLTGKSVREIEADRMGTIREAAARLHAYIVLKGPHSLIGTPDGRVFINLTGNSGMATAGSGDVLTGTISAMTGLGMDAEDAVKKGVYLHGAAGDLAAETKGEDGMTAGDILEHLPYALKKDRGGEIRGRMPARI